MSSVHPRWVGPTEFSFENLDPSRPLIESRRLCDWPALHLLAMRDVESHLVDGAIPPLALAAWQVVANADTRAGETAETVLATSTDLDERLSCAHVLATANLSDGSQRIEVYRPLWNEIGEGHPRRLELGVSLAGEVLVIRHEKALEVLDRVRPLLESAPPEPSAMFDLVFAMAARRTDPDASEAAIVRAHDRFSSAGDPIGMAQCALAEYQRVRDSAAPHSLLAYLEYAVHQYRVSCRYAWASSVLWFAVVPLLVDRLRAPPEDLTLVFERAADFAERGRSFRQLDSVRHMAARLGLTGRMRDGSWLFEPFNG